MKKTLLILGVAAGVLFTSCDPAVDKGTFDYENMTAESLLNGATFAQFDQVTDDAGNVSYVPSETGNYIQYNIPKVSAVNIFYEKSGERKTLSYGRAGGMFYYLPSRGSDPTQTLYFAYVNQDGQEVVASKQFTLDVAQALAPAVKVLVSNKGVKKWKWMPTETNGGAVWGNGGWMGEQDGSASINGAWWGCGVNDGDCPNKFSDQTNHAGGRYEEIKGECSSLSYMEFNEDGSLTTFSPDGTQITTGTFSVKDYNNNEVTNQSNHSRGTLETSEGAILWPFAINTDGMQPKAFQIGWLDPSRLILIYKNGTADDAECTWWSFMSDDDPEGILASHDWHWKPTSVNGGAVWGNGGWMGAQDGTGNINGGWWGCGVNDGDCPNKFSDQTNHAGGKYDEVEAECYSQSYMTFNEDEATVTVYGKDGNKMREGSFSIDWAPTETRMGTINTSEGAIMWPFIINTDGKMASSFQIGYLGGDAMILIFKNGTADDAECTWWSFGK